MLTGEKIAYIADKIVVPTEGFAPVKVIDAEGMYIMPGFIDGHVHIIGGGGEGGYKTRTPELQLTDATLAGVTTVVGLLGTDGTTRTMEALVAKARALNDEGITCYIMSGSYQVPVRTLTGKMEDDLLLIDLVIGAGEIAIADHRSSQPTVEEMAKIASAARIGGMLSGKAGIVTIHVGDGDDQLDILEKVTADTNIPIKQFYPTHLNRNADLFQRAIEFGKRGGYIDLTTSTTPKFLEEGEVKCSTALKILLDNEVNSDHITFTSDGQASLPDFNEDGELIGLKVGKVSTIFKEVRDAILHEAIPIELAIKVITENPARILKLPHKGNIEVGKDADLVLIDKKTFTINTLFAKGALMVQNGQAIRKGTFE